MRLISYGGKAYVTDGFSRRYVPTPTILNQLLATAGQAAATPVTKEAFDFLDELVPGKSLQLDHLNLTNQVENLRRIVVDLHV